MLKGRRVHTFVLGQTFTVGFNQIDPKSSPYSWSRQVQKHCNHNRDTDRGAWFVSKSDICQVAEKIDEQEPNREPVRPALASPQTNGSHRARDAHNAQKN